MKKLIKLILAIIMVITISACSKSDDSNEVQKIKLDKENKIADTISFKIETIDQTDGIMPDVLESIFNYYKPSSSKKILLDMSAMVTNLTDNDLELNKTFEAMFTIDNTDYEASLLSISNDGKTISTADKITANNSMKIHYYIEVDPDLLDQKIKFTISTIVDEDSDDKQVSAALDFKIDDAKKNYESISSSDTLSFENSGQLVLQGVTTAKELRSTNPTGLYNYYYTKDDKNSFLILKTQITNQSGGDMSASSLATIKLLDKNDKPYSANVIYEEANGSDLALASTITLTPNQSATVYYAFEISDDLINENKTIRIVRDGKVYSFDC